MNTTTSPLANKNFDRQQCLSGTRAFCTYTKKATKEVLESTSIDQDNFHAIFESQIMKWQNKIYRYIQLNNRMVFDMAVRNFLIEHYLSQSKELSEIWDNNHYSFQAALTKLKKDNPHTFIYVGNIDQIHNRQKEPQLYISCILKNLLCVGISSLQMIFFAC